MANIDSLCNQLERLFNGYMNVKEEQTGKLYKNWDDITDEVRKGLNKIRKVKTNKFDINDFVSIIITIIIIFVVKVCFIAIFIIGFRLSMDFEYD